MRTIALLALFAAAAQAQTGPVTRHTGAGNGKVLQSCPIPANATTEQKGAAVEACFGGVPVGQNYTLKLQGTKTAPAPAPAPAPSPAPAPAPTPAPAPAPAPGSPIAKMQATRVSGTAPLAVLFDATGSTGPANPFHALTYQFNFGDDRALVWAVSGAPKNVQVGGPIAAHVYDLPGTYTAKVRALDKATGLFTEVTTTIVVDDPATVYASAKTVCVSISSTFTGCPAGAVTQTALPTSYAGKRVLLRGGETFGQITIKHTDSKAVVGSFGTGKAKVAKVGISEGPIPVAGVFPDDVTVMDLNITGGISHMNSGSRFLLYRNDLTQAGGNNSIHIGGALAYSVSTSGWAASTFYFPREMFLVENKVVGATNIPATPGYNFFGHGSRMAFLGNDMGKSEHHTMRLTGAHKSIVAHNALRGQSSAGNGSSLKVHSAGLLAYADNYATTMGKWATSHVVVANNLFGDPADNNAWTSATAPQNGTSEEGLEDVIVENNRFIRGARTNTEMVMVGRRLTARGNSRVDGGAPNINNASTLTFNLPADWKGPYWIQ